MYDLWESPYRKKSGRIKSCYHGGHSPLEMILSLKKDFISLMLPLDKWDVTPYCWKKPCCKSSSSSSFTNSWRCSLTQTCVHCFFKENGLNNPLDTSSMNHMRIVGCSLRNNWNHLLLHSSSFINSSSGHLWSSRPLGFYGGSLTFDLDMPISCKNWCMDFISEFRSVCSILHRDLDIWVHIPLCCSNVVIISSLFSFLIFSH